MILPVPAVGVSSHYFGRAHMLPAPALTTLRPTEQREQVAYFSLPWSARRPARRQPRAALAAYMA